MTRRTQQESSWHTGLAQLVNLLQVGGRCELRTQSCRSKGTCLISLIGSPIFYKSSWCIQLWSFIWCFLCRCWHRLFSCSFRLKINPFYGKIFQLTSVTAWRVQVGCERSPVPIKPRVLGCQQVLSSCVVPGRCVRGLTELQESCRFSDEHQPGEALSQDRRWYLTLPSFPPTATAPSLALALLGLGLIR